MEVYKWTGKHIRVDFISSVILILLSKTRNINPENSIFKHFTSTLQHFVQVYDEIINNPEVNQITFLKGIFL